MARKVTLGEIKLRAKRRCDMEHTNFVTDSEWNEYINASYAELYDIIVQTYEDYYVLPPVEITIAQGANTMDLPADFYKLKGIDYKQGISSGNDWGRIRKFDFNKRNQDSNLMRVVGYYNYRRYRIIGDKIYITPTEDAAGTYRLWYNPPISTLVNDTDEIDGVNGWEEYIVVDAAIKAKEKEESSTTGLEKAKDKLLVRIQSSANERDIGEPNAVSDYEANYDDMGVYGGGWF